MRDEAVIAAVRALRADRVHGAMELAMQAVASAVNLLATQPQRDVREVARALCTARPSMAAIGNAVALTLAPIVNHDADRQELRERVAMLHEQWAADTTCLTDVAKLHIPEAILTYSHSSSTRNVLLAIKDHLRTVIIPEGRPVDDGKGLARILAAAGIPVTVITEAQMGQWVREVMLSSSARTPLHRMARSTIIWVRQRSPSWRGNMGSRSTRSHIR